MLFKPMKLKEAREFYEKLGKSKTDWLCRTGRDDIYFFTNGLTTDYGKPKTEEKIKERLKELYEQSGNIEMPAILRHVQEDYEALIDIGERYALDEEDHTTLEHILDYLEIFMESIGIGEIKND